MTRFAMLVAVIFLGPACSLSPVDFTGRPCPCAPGWTCMDDVVCVQSDTTPADDCDFPISNLRADFRTPEAIYFRWDTDVTVGSDGSFELHVGTDESATRASALGDDTPGVIVFDRTINPELGERVIPRTGNDDDPVAATFADGLTPSTDYFAILVATDSAGGTCRSNLVRAATNVAPEGEQVVIMTDGTTFGFVLPDCIPPRTDPARSAAGTSEHYAFFNQCMREGDSSAQTCGTPMERAPTCFSNLNFGGSGADLSVLPAGRFDEAFLEFWVAIDDSSHGFWAGVTLLIDGCAHQLEPITFRADGQYRKYQVALEGLRSTGSGSCPSGTTLTHAAAARPISSFMIGSLWADQATIRVDEVRVLW